MFLIFNSIYILSFLLTLLLSFCPFIVLCNNISIFNNEESTEATNDADCSNRLNIYRHCLDNDKCLSYIQLPNGNITINNIDNIETLHFSCLPGYHLTGPPKIICQEWDDIFEKPACIKGCLKPPMIVNGEVLINGDKEDNQLFSDGVVAEYACAAGYRLTPIISQHRVCRQGEWTGSPVSCVFEGCPRLKGILNGHVELEREVSIDKILPKEITEDIIMDNSEYIKGGVIIKYKCDAGFILIGPSFAKCQASGTWQPHTLPKCKRSKFSGNRTISSSKDFYSPIKTSAQDYFQNENAGSSVGGIGASCLLPPLGSHVQVLAVQTNTDNNAGETTNTVPDGTVIEATCAFGYRDKHSPCVPQILQCDEGSWQGHLPSCDKADNCLFPSKIPHGEFESVTDGIGGGLFGVGGQVTYSCLPGYQLIGESLLTCQTGGCWDPNIIPMCEPQFYWSANWPEYLNTNTSLLLSVVTALSVLFVLLSVCVAVVCRHRPTPLHHHHPAAPPAPPILVPPPPDPDRVALIAFADGIQSGLPSYEEAVRGSSGGGRGLLSYRLQHPPWSQRRNPRPDATIVTRQLSSTGDSMGSTDTMTVSDVSTNVTLDTVSSHTCSSTSQTASCRAICGSLASFDTSSVINTEGVPLLEENELEENGANMDLDDTSMLPACDNTSFKLQSDIDSIHS